MNEWFTDDELALMARVTPLVTPAQVIADARNPNCQECPLHENAQTVCLMGNGPVDARVVIVGQAPGRNEDQRGVPFIGRAGNLLNEELERAGIPRDSVYVTNAAKCYPPDDRAPTISEVKACRQYLEAELEAIKPELVITLGNVPMQGLLGKSGILKMANAVYEKNGLSVLPTVHPAFVLRDPTHMDTLRNGLLTAKRFLDGNTQAPETTIHMIDTEEAWEVFTGRIADAALVSIDIESSTPTKREMGGLQTWAPDWQMDTVAFAWVPGEAWVLPWQHFETPWRGYERKDMAYDLQKILSLKKIVGHNIKFDAQGMAAAGIDVIDAIHFDTLIAAHLLDENRASKGLKALARQYLGAEVYDDDIKKDGTDPLDKLALYNGRDADYTLQLYAIFRAEMLASPALARIFMGISMPAARTLARVEHRGIPVSIRRLRDRHVELKKRIKTLEDEMLTYVPVDMLITAKGKARAKWNRSHFLLQFMFETLGLPVLKETPKSKDSDEEWKKAAVDNDVLQQLRGEHPMVDLLIERRALNKQESTYTRPWIKQILLTRKPVLYPNYNITGTETGRLSSNFQQVPRDNFIRGIISAPPGYKLIEADFSQIELRVAAMITGDAGLVGAYQRGEDLHRQTAAALTGKPPEEVTKAERTTAKAVGFGLLYGAGWRKLQEIALNDYGVEMSDNQAKGYRNLFFSRYPRLGFWHDSQRRMVGALGYVESPIGRRRRLPSVNSMDKEVVAQAERQAINSPVQGFASDLTLLAMSEIEQSDLFFLTGAQLIGQVHDSLLFLCPEQNASQAALEIKEMMETLGPIIERKFGYSLPVPIVADTSISRHWGGV